MRVSMCVCNYACVPMHECVCSCVRAHKCSMQLGAHSIYFYCIFCASRLSRTRWVKKSLPIFLLRLKALSRIGMETLQFSSRCLRVLHYNWHGKFLKEVYIILGILFSKAYMKKRYTTFTYFLYEAKFFKNIIFNPKFIKFYLCVLFFALHCIWVFLLGFCSVD